MEKVSQMADSFTLEITSPSGIVFSGPMKHVRAPGREGSFGVLPSHTPFITPLQVGVIEGKKEDGADLIFATSGGMAEVHGDKVVVLAETAEEKTKIDIERARQSRERAEKRLADPEPDLDTERARAALARAMNRLAIAGS
ncbi:F0F1 ATP synthase subunit epsilon [bacterium]|nr:F0F1 ATP synthase subunit epsilon [bacterium]